MTDQEIVDHIALMAKPRFMELLRLKIPHVYDDTPGGQKAGLKLVKAVQPYASIERFMQEDKLVGFVINPGLLPIVKAISLDIRGKQSLLTRRIASRPGDQGAIAHIDGFGVRVQMFYDEDEGDTHIVWECLYAVS